MSRLEHFLLKRIFRNQVRQGEGHAKRIQYLYLIVRHAVEEEFPDDNYQTLESFLKEQFQKALLFGGTGR